MDFPVRDNLVLSDAGRPPFGRWWALSQPALLSNARALIERFRIATPGPLTPVDKLSGGNQQKVVVAREVDEEAALIIAAQATRGLDVDATRFVMDEMVAASQRGAGVLYISTELEEIMALSDTIGVIYEGRIVGLIPAAEASLETIGLWMAGEAVASGGALAAREGA
jgi:simple sugar transport system ATP-binding protein